MPTSPLASPSEAVPVRIIDLRPTQITLGLREVAQKRLRWRSRLHGRRAARAPLVPVVLGPSGRLYLVDRHHLVRALAEEGEAEVLTRAIADLRDLTPHDLWPALDARGWCHPHGPDGRRRSYDEIPSTIGDLRDDPYRSLASALRRAGGFAKKTAPFSEFAWADFLRRRIPASTLALDFDAALGQALRLAGTPAARDLPGWRPDLLAIPRADAAPRSAHVFR